MTATGCYLTVDLEDYKQTTTLEMGVPQKTEPARTVHGVARILSALSETPGNQTATFFTTGQIARDQADLVSELATGGHEIGCHADLHEDIYDLDAADFAAVLMRARASIVDACGIAPTGFRAPNFSIDDRCPWALEVLASAGFTYDSSLVSTAPRDSATPYDTYRFHGDTLREFPVYRHMLPGGIGVRVIGGTYLRLLPLPIILRLMKDVSAKGYPLIVYVHPSDLDDDFDPVRTDEMEGLDRMTRLKWALRQKQWAAGTEGAFWKLREILKVHPNIGPMGHESIPAAAADPQHLRHTG
tara:strand:- start:2057 stop:2956 length:900 start_codon:yes stop_codon:yes gene_type:complete